MIRDFMEPIVKTHVDEILSEKLLERIGSDPADFEHIFALNEEWKPKPPKPVVRFTGG
jgi:hypothetical protein